jgi:hypothetical protein
MDVVVDTHDFSPWHVDEINVRMTPEDRKLVHPGFLLCARIWLCGSDRRRDPIDV